MHVYELPWSYRPSTTAPPGQRRGSAGLWAPVRFARSLGLQTPADQALSITLPNLSASVIDCWKNSESCFVGPVKWYAQLDMG